MATTALCLAASASAPAHANPQGGTVAGGNATIQQTTPNRVDVIQSTDRAVINWNSFSIGAGEQTNFQQPGPKSVTLNRVTGGDTSRIEGALTANGNVYLINPNGVMFGPTSRVDVGGLVATTSDIRTDNFMAGRDRFDQPSSKPGAKVSNAGSITVKDGGLAALVAPDVENSGVIQAKLGRVAIAGTDRFAVDLNGDGLLSFEVGPAPAGAKVTHSGTIKADGGTVLLSAEAAKGVVDNVINASGVIEAKAVSAQGGTIVLSGGGGGVKVSGRLDASGSGAQQSGGTVKVLGDRIAVESGARLDASGPAGGGTVLVGGNWQGQGPEPNATSTTIEAGAVIAAGSERGKAGKVVVWADGTTRMDGRVSAKRGKVETSGKKTLKVGATAQVEAADWLLDPRNVTISGGTTSNVSDDAGTTTRTYAGTGDDAVVNAATILTSLNGGTNITITTGSDGTQDGTITVATSLTWSGATTLSLNAAGNVRIDGAITASNSGSALAILAGGGIGQTAGIDVAGATSLRADGAITLTNAANDFRSLAIAGKQNAGAQSASIATGGGSLQIAGASVTGDLAIDAGNASISQSAAITVGGLTTLKAATPGIITLDDAGNSIGRLAVTRGKDLTLNTTGAVSLEGIAIGGDLTLTAGGHVTQTAALSIGGGANVGVTAASSDILLHTQANSIKDGLTVAGTLDNLRDLGLRNTRNDATLPTLSGLTNLRNLYVAFDNNTVVLPTLSASGDISVTSNGAITQATGSTVTVAGTATLTAPTNSAITLDNSGNDFGTVVVTQGKNVTLNDSNAIVLGAISLGTGNLTVTAAGDITQSGALTTSGDLNLTVNTGGTSIVLDNAGNTLTGGFGVGGTGLANLTLVDTTAVALPALSLSGGLTITSGAGITQTGALSIGGTATFTATNDVVLDRTDNHFATIAIGGAVNATIVNDAALVLGASTVTGALAVTAGGDITQSGALSVTGDASFTANGTATSILLGDSGNSFGGTLSFTGTGLTTVTIFDTTALALPALTLTGDLTASGAGITQTGTLDIGGTLSVTAASGTDILLDDPTNHIRALLFGGGRNATIVSLDSIVISGGGVTGDLTLTAGGAITQSAALTVGGNATFAAGGSAITLTDGGNDFVTIGASGGVVQITDKNGVTLAATTAGSLAVTAAGNIGQSGALTVTGGANFAANGAVAQITLTDATNQFGGTVTVGNSAGTTTLALAGSGDLTVSAAGALNLAALGTSGNATVTAAGAITDSAALTVGGTAALSTRTAGGAAITLDNAGSSFGALDLRVLNTSGNSANAAITVSSTGNLVFAGLRTGGGALLSAAGISQTGAFSITGGLTLTGTATQSDFNLASQSNGIDSLAFGGTLGNIHDLALRTGSAIDLTAVGALGNLHDLTLRFDSGNLTLPGVTVGGNLSLQAGGAIGQGGDIKVNTGTATINAGTSATLIGTGNHFNRLNLTAASGNIRDNATLTFSGASIGGNLIVNAGSIAQTGAMSVGGTMTATTTGGIALGNSGNAIGSFGVGGATDVTLTTGGSLNIQNLTASGNVALTAGNTVDDIGQLAIAGALSVTTHRDAGASVILDTAANTYGALTLRARNGADTDAANGAITVKRAAAVTIAQIETDGAVTLASGNAITAQGTGDLNLAGLSATGASIATTGAITDSGTLSVTNNASFSGATITLDGSNNTFGSVTANATGDIALRASGALTVAQLATGGNASLTATGAITDTGTLSVGGTLSAVTLNNSGAAIVLDSASNSYASLTARSRNANNNGAAGGNITVNRNGGLTIGQVETNGLVTLSATGATGAIDAQATGNLNIGGLTTSGSASLRATGAINDSGAISVGGALALTTLNDAGAAITIDRNDNSFGSFSARVRNAGDTANANADITLTRQNFPGIVSTQLGTIQTGGNLTLTTFGAVTQSGPATVGGITTINLPFFTADVLLNNGGNNFNIVQFSGGANVAISDSNGFTLNGSNASGGVTLTSGGTVFQAGGLTANGLTLAASAANVDFILDNAANAITGAVGFSGTQSNVRDVTLRNASGAAQNPTVAGLTGLRNLTLTFDQASINLGQATVSNDLRLTALNGSIDQSGAFSVGGTTTLAALNGKDITLGNAGNNFNNLVMTSGRDLTVVDSTAINLAGITAGRDVTVTAGGAISDSAALTIAGDLSLTTRSNGIAAITLDNAGNSYGKLTARVLDLSDAAGTGDITVVKGTALNLAALQTSGSATITTSGNLTQSGAAKIGGTLSLNTGATHDVVLTRTDNDFGVVAIGAARDVSLTDATGITLGTSTVSGDLTVLAGGAIGQSGALTVTGLTTLRAAAGTDILLANAANQFAAVKLLAGRDSTLTDIDAIDIAGATLTGRLTVTASNGAVTQSASIAAAEIAATASGAIVLDDAGNQIAAARGLSGAGVALTTAGALAVSGPVTATGSGNTIALAAGGALNLTGAVNAGTAGTMSLKGSSIVQSGGGVITAQTLTGAQTGAAGTTDLSLGNHVTRLGAFAADGNFTFRTLDALQLTGALTAANSDVILTTGGALTQTTLGAVAANRIRLAATGAIDWSTANNGIGRVLGATGTRVAITDTTGGLFIDGAVTGSTGPVALITAGGTLRTGAAITGNGVTLRGLGLALDSGTVVNAGGGLLALDAGAGSFDMAAGTTAKTTGLATLQSAASALVLGDVTIGDRLDGAVGGDAVFSGGNQIAGIGAFSTGGRFELLNAANDLTVSGALAAGGGLTLRMTTAGAGVSVTSAGALTAGGGQDLTLEADRMGFAGAVSGTGVLYLRPHTLTRSIGIGDDASGDLKIATGGIGNLVEGFTRIELGDTDYAGAMQLGTATFKDALTVRAPKLGASIRVVGALHVAGVGGPRDVLLIGPGASTTLDGSITTDGGAIAIQDRVHVGGNAALDTTGNGNGGGAAITLMGPVDGTTAYGEQLTLNAGTNGDLLFMSAVGVSTPLGTVLVPNASSFTANQPFVAATLDVRSNQVEAAQVNIRDSMIVRGTGGNANITGTVAGLGDEFAARLVQRPDGPADTYIINGCVMGTLCGVDPNFFVNFELMRTQQVVVTIQGFDNDASSLFAIQRTTDLPRSTELIGPRDQEPGSIATAAGGAGGFGGGMRPAGAPAPVDPSTIQYSSAGDWEQW